MAVQNIEPIDWAGRFGLDRGTAEAIGCQLAVLPRRQEATEALARLLEQLDALGRAALAAPLAGVGLARLAYAAPFLLRHLMRHAAHAEALLAGLDAPGALLPWSDYCAPDKLAGLEEEELLRRLRIWKYDNYLRFTIQDLLGLHDTAHTCALISHLADSMISTAYRYAFTANAAQRGLPVREDGAPALGAVIGMGKLGGGELNYASDIDLIFIHEGGDAPCRKPAARQKPPAPDATEAEYWARWQASKSSRSGEGTASGEGRVSSGEFHNQLARQVIRILGANTADGIGFRVDVDLRPQGKSGLLAPSLAFIRQYYDVHGREWERTALLKARMVGGAPEVFGRFEEAIRPFVYRRYLDYSAVEGIAIVKHDINRNHHMVLESNLKLGSGGIRENEFLVQALQLLYGGKKPELRVTSHQQAVRQLIAAGILQAEEGEAHLADYWLMRKIENRLQMENEAQIHELPEEEAARQRVFADFAPDFARRWPAPEQALDEARARTAQRFAQLFADMGSGDYPGPEMWERAIGEFCPPETREEALARVDGLINRLMASRVGERCVFKVARLLTNPELYRQGTDAAFPRWLDFLDQIGNRNAIHTLMESSPAIASWASAIFAEGGLHASLLIRHPEFMESFVTSVTEGVTATEESFTGILENARDEEEFLLDLQSARSQALMRILTAYLEAPLEKSHRESLSELAQTTVNLCLRYTWGLVAERYGLPEGAAEGEVSGIAVLAMGKLGSREMRFGSDLDLVFVYGEEGTTAGGKSHYEFYTRLAQKMGNLLTAPTQFGKLYEIDHRLRPFGSKSVLVPTLMAFRDFVKSAEVWNFQAFTRMRHLCGEKELSAAVIAAIGEAWRTRALDASQVTSAVREMLGRLVAEHAPPEAAGERLALKYATGGMIGFEFLGQLYFLLNQPSQEHPWDGGPEAGEIRALRPAYDTISALDERLSFHEPRFHHEVTREHFESLAALREGWNFEELRSLGQELETRVEAAFQSACNNHHDSRP